MCILQIEPTRNCNLKCKHCVRSNEHGDISIETYTKLLKSHDPMLFDWLKLQGLGERMMYHDIARLVDLGHKYDYKKVVTITNGTLPIIGAFDRVIVSLNSVRELKFSQVMYNVNNALERGYYITINCVLTDETTRQDVKNMADLAENLGIYIDFTPMEVWSDPSCSNYENLKSRALKVYDLFNIREKHNVKCCDWGVTSLYYDYIGRLHPCCTRMTDNYIIEDVDHYNFDICKECPL